MSKPQNITVLGATGSIGTNTLDVIGRHPEDFCVFALSGATQVDLLAAQCQRFNPVFAVLAREAEARSLEHKLLGSGVRTRVLWGESALAFVASHENVDVVMAAVVGAAGLAPCLAAAKTGKRLLLANKEALVVGGKLFMDAVVKGGALLLPIDSEHSAIFQSLPEDPACWAERVEKIILTASGGPFRALDPALLSTVTPEQACAHPNWQMGKKISVDSATMMNKALEVIEAHFLFKMPPEKIEVVIHPQSIIHSMVQYRDTSIVAQLGSADMRVPIAYGLSWPARFESGATPIDFSRMANMTFDSIASSDNLTRFPGLHLAWDVIRAKPGTTAVLNAANEVAVEAFLSKKIRFDQIHAVNLHALSSMSIGQVDSLDALLDLDRNAREISRAKVNHLTC